MRRPFLIAGLLVTTLVFTNVANMSKAQAHDDAKRTPTISVSARGSAEAAPDMAVLTMTVSREAKTARDALDANNTAMAAVLKSLKSLGVAERDLQTSGFSINPKMSYPNRSAQDRTPRLVGYIVNNTLTARVRDLKRLGALLDKSVSLGVNQGGQIRFTNDKPDAILSKARAQAMQSAIAKAKTLVGAANVSLGRITEISEHSNTPRPMPMAAQGRMAMSVAEDSSVPIQAGENRYSVTVNVTWEIKQ